MKTLARPLIALGVALVMAVIFSWPLARHASEGIPSSAVNIEAGNRRAMIPGDHLQFLYHMWLAKDTITGHTPLFYNLYEFNAGDDEERYEVRPYYLPFSLFFTLGALVGNQAIAWNGMIVLTLGLTYGFSWMLARRYVKDAYLSALIAVLALVWPFMWMALLGGSPTGLAMMWAPLLLYGIDRWVADRSASGAALVGAVVFFSEWSDTHVFFFSVLMTPCWLAVTYLYRCGWRLPTRAEGAGWLRSAWPLGLFLALAAGKAWSVRQGLRDTAIASGRSMHEIDLYSHGLGALIDAKVAGGAKTYVGLYGLVLLGAAIVGLAWRAVRRPANTRIVAALLVFFGIGGVMLLSTGPRNPWGPEAWKLLIKAVPPYGMIRQPDKIFCFMPALLVAGLAMTMAALVPRVPIRALRIGLTLALLPLFHDYASRLNPAVCLLDDRQEAYAAVRQDAERRGEAPRALALPLWPGDSHWSSPYQYYASLYRIRMVNGYRPTARKTYLNAVFEPYETMNAGYPSDAQLDGLRAMGVRHLLLHEDAFPEKVGSFPVGATLAGLMSHPRLRLRARDGSVWCFEILDEPAPLARTAHTDKMPVLFPVRIWDWASSPWPDAMKRASADAVGGRYVHIAEPMATPMPSRYIRTAGPFPLAWHVRARGHGTFDLLMEAGDRHTEATLNVQTDAWTWLRATAPETRDAVEQTAGIRVREGALDVDALLLTRADWAPPASGETMTVPAAAFFRSGYTLDDLSGVALRKRQDANAEIFYARHLYLEPGEYETTLVFDTGAPAGARLGEMRIWGEGDERPASAPVLAGAPAVVRHAQKDNRLFRFAFAYDRTADVILREVRFRRLR